MNTNTNNNQQGGHHGEFQRKSNPNRTHVYRKDTSMQSIERALDKIAGETPAPSARPQGQNGQGSRSPFHAKRMDRGSRRGGRNDRPRHFSRTEQPAQRPRKDDVIPPLKDGDLRIIAIGGVEQIGAVNMTAVQYKDQIVVIDSGLQFSNQDTPGIDMVIPNTKYLEDNKHMVKAMVITHGHLDHIGSIPFVMESMGNPPIYTREFGAMVIKKRNEEYPDLAPLDLRIVDREEGSIRLSDDLKVRFFGLTHSIPDSTGVIIETPYGDIVSTGDVRVENFDGIPTDEEVQQYSVFKDRNVLLMTLDSTGIDKPGWTISEKIVSDTVDKIIRDVKGRLIIATFASQVERIMEFLKSAKRYGRTVVIDGRAIKTNLGIVKHLGLDNLENVVGIEDLHKYPANKVMLLVTGGQGEQYSVLDRVSKGTHKYLKLESTDTIVFSSSVIPGNEKTIDELKDALYRKDPKIITYYDTDVHASGHGKRGELEWVHKQIKYQYFMPVHGNYARLMMHRDMVMNLGIPKDRIIIPEANGTIIEFRGIGNPPVILKEKTPNAVIAVEGTRVGELQDVVIRDRKLLLESGVFNVFAVIDERTGKLKKSPDIFSRGFVYIRENQDLFHKVRGLVKKIIEERTLDPKYSVDALKEELIEKVERFLMQKTGKKPIVMAAIVTA